MDKQKFTLLEAYECRHKHHSIESLDELNNIYTEVEKFIDYCDAKVRPITIWHGFMHQQYGCMVKILQKMYEDKIQKDGLEELQYVVTEMK